jgi:hypothetical protein
MILPEKRKFLVPGLLLSFIFSANAQDSSYRMSPSGTSVAEARFAFVSMPEDYIGEKKTVKEGKWNGLCISFHTNIFVNIDESRRWRSGDYLGFSGGIGGSRHGFWYNGRIDLGWQIHYAITHRSDFGFRAYGTMMADRIGFNGIMLHPSFRFGGLYMDLAVGLPIGYPTDRPRSYAEGGFRLLFPNDSKTNTDRWFVGFKTAYTKATNYDNSKTNTGLTHFYITGGLML